jgi:predicted enzyme related to lactoylglutathione lyase
MEVLHTMATETAQTGRSSAPATTATIVHIEVPANDAKKLQGFYSDLFGWKFEAMPAMPDYAAANIGEADDMLGFAVFSKMSEGSAPVNYIGVESVAEHSAKVEKLGGKVLHSFVVAHMGRGAVCADPEGNMVGLWQSDPSATE